MGLDDKKEKKLDDILQHAKTLDADEQGEGEAPSTPSPAPKAVNLDTFKAEVREKDRKTKCRICNSFILDIDKHLGSSETNCGRLVKDVGGSGEPDPALIEAMSPYFGAMVCLSVLEMLEDWLKPDFKKMTKDWESRTTIAIQRIAEERIAEYLQSPYIILLVCASQFVIVNKDGIRKKFGRTFALLRGHDHHLHHSFSRRDKLQSAKYRHCPPYKCAPDLYVSPAGTPLQ